VTRAEYRAYLQDKIRALEAEALKLGSMPMSGEPGFDFEAELKAAVRMAEIKGMIIAYGEDLLNPSPSKLALEASA
jgi:hypothetical protein